MDSEARVMRQQINETMAGLTDKLGKLEHEILGTVRTVKDSVNTVRDTFDLKLHVRQRPWTLLAGAAALGFLWGSRSSNRGHGLPPRNGKSASAPLDREDATEHPHAGANNGKDGANAAPLSAATAPSWLANLGNTFQPEVAALRGIAGGALFELVRELIAKQAARPAEPPVRGANNGSKDRPQGQDKTSR